MKRQILSWLTLYSSVLVFSCVTVPRIDKKDSRNNSFSEELQNWMAVKHPQRIDTAKINVLSDTTVSELDSIYYVDNSIGEIGGVLSDTLSDYIAHNIYWQQGSSYLTIDSSNYDRVLWDSLWIKHDTITKIIVKTKTITITDTVRYTVYDQTQVGALSSYLKVSRDSTNQYILNYTQEKSTARLRLIWIIVMGVVIAAGIYLLIKKSIL